jgi:hypothetical protein
MSMAGQPIVAPALGALHVSWAGMQHRRNVVCATLRESERMVHGNRAISAVPRIRMWHLPHLWNGGASRLRAKPLI